MFIITGNELTMSKLTAFIIFSKEMVERANCDVKEKVVQSNNEEG